MGQDGLTLAFMKSFLVPVLRRPGRPREIRSRGLRQGLSQDLGMASFQEWVAFEMGRKAWAQGKVEPWV